MNVMAAEAALRKSLSWREKRGVDFLLNWKPPEVILPINIYYSRLFPA